MIDMNEFMNNLFYDLSKFVFFLFLGTIIAFLKKRNQKKQSDKFHRGSRLPSFEGG